MIEVGDHVTVGRGTTQWTVLSDDSFGALLRSDLTGIRRYADFYRLTLFKKGDA